MTSYDNKCRRCDADIIWGRASKSKKWLPLDAMRVTRGVRFVVSEEGLAYTITSGPGHPSHHATCPNAKVPDENDDSQGELDV